MKIAITGSSGLIGTAVSARLADEGHTLTRVVRSRDEATASDAVYWKPSAGEIDAEGLAGHDAVINLAGENIFGVWTDAKRDRIYHSRVDGTRLISETIAGLDDTRRPATLVNASAIGYYGDRPAREPMTEDATPGSSFMAGVVRDWEAATAPAAEAGIRVVRTRFGLVLDPDSLLLQGMSASSRLGLGAKLGDGDQPFPWVTLDEIAEVMVFLLGHPEVEGAVNVVGTEKVTNEEFADAVASVVNRPRVLRVPAFAMRLLGDLGDELLSGAWVVPEKLKAAGYQWRDPELEPALRRMLT
jgi:uncharacterized protein (TIGR01777 family)